ncbi:MAG: M28 family peptidase [Baekduia sp.]
MLDPRLYRAAFLPAVLVLLVVAFSLGTRPRPIGTTLAADTFSGAQALAQLDRLAAQYPDRRAGSAGDRALASEIARQLRRVVPGTVEEDVFDASTIDGGRELVNVVASRPGAPGPAIVVVAHRDAAGTGARAELSGTAALLELARIAGAGRLQRTITFISTSGGSGGFAGAVRAAESLERPVDAVIVLGAVGATASYKPIVSGASNGAAQAPLQLARTVRQAVAAETGLALGAPRAFIQGMRMAAPATTGEQGPFLRAGFPAVLVSSTGERTPGAQAGVSAQRIEGIGRGVLRALYALDNGPDISEAGPTQALVVRGKVLPGWAVRVLVLAFLLPALVVAVDAIARLRRRREAVGRWAVWALSAALPAACVCVAAVIVAKTGLITGVPAPVPATSLTMTAGAAAAAVVLVIVAALAWILLRPALLGAAGLTRADRPDPPGAGVATGAVIPFAALALWFANPFAAGAMVPAAHLWLWATAPETRITRGPAAALLAAGAALPLLVAVLLSRILGLSPGEAPWFGVLLVAGGHTPWWSWLLWSAFTGAAISAMLLLVRRSPVPGAPEEITVRGPETYAGPGSLGGTPSALRR